MPSLLAAPRNDRHYYRGRLARGVGSPHTPRGYLWPLASIVRALTSSDRCEVAARLRALALSTGTDGLVHESFDPNDPRRFTRADFGWANAIYAELLFRTAADFPAEVSSPPPAMTPFAHGDGSIAVVDPATAIANRGALLDAFERAVPLPVIGGS